MLTYAHTYTSQHRPAYIAGNRLRRDTQGYLPPWLSNSSLTVFESQFVVIESQSTTGIREMSSALQEPFRSLRDVLAPKYLRCRGPHIFAPDLMYNSILCNGIVRGHGFYVCVVTAKDRVT